MLDNDRVKNKYTISNYRCTGITFVVTTYNGCKSLHTIHCNKTVQDIQKFLIEKGSVYCHKLKNKGMIYAKFDSLNPFDVFHTGNRLIKKVIIPIFLYSAKNDLKDEINRLSKKHNIDSELLVSHDVSVYIAGKNINVYEGAHGIYTFIEGLMGKASKKLSGFYKMKDIRNVGKISIYTLTRINDGLFIVTGNPKELELLKNIKQVDVLYEKKSKVDSAKLLYLVYYKKIELENILCAHECYLSYDTYFRNDNMVISLKGYTRFDLYKAYKKLCGLLQDCLKILYKTATLFLCSFEVIHFYLKDIKGDDIFLAIGSRDEIKNLLKEFSEIDRDAEFEVELEIDEELEDFLCGKKNGKINKISKENQCEVQITQFVINPLEMYEPFSTILTTQSSSCGIKSTINEKIHNLNNDLKKMNITTDNKESITSKSENNTIKNKKVKTFSNQNLAWVDVGRISDNKNNVRTMNIYVRGNSENIYATLTQLEYEFPAQLCFFLHDRHHRRIIGYGGKNIQKIMKKHGVYIKFMNEEERISSGYSGNVIIKTPKRNSASLFKMKKDVLLLAEENDVSPSFFETKLDLFHAYELNFIDMCIYYEHAIVYEKIIGYLKTYVLKPPQEIPKFHSKNGRSGFGIIRLVNQTEFYVLSFDNLPFRHISVEVWLESLPKLAIDIFSSKLLFSHKATVHDGSEAEKVNLKPNQMSIIECFDNNAIGRRSDKTDEAK